ncbi:hypothetical protein GCM10020219_055660 [Nonomuraea dietziae]
MVRRHPAVLLRPVAEVFGGLIVAGLLSKFFGDQGGGTALVVVWWLWLLLLIVSYGKSRSGRSTTSW